MKTIQRLTTNVLIMLMLLSVSIISCTKNEPTISEESREREVTISATLPQPTQTRALFENPTWSSEAGYGFNKVTWEVGDKISILCWQGEDSNWGKRINEKDNWGNIKKDKGEIIHTLTENDISDDKRSINFNFKLPSDIDDNQKVHVLLTYLGNEQSLSGTAYYNTDANGLSWLYLQQIAVNGYDNAEFFTEYKYISYVMPMTLRGIVSGGGGSEKSIISGTFKHLCTLFAVDVENNLGVPDQSAPAYEDPTQPDKIAIQFKNGQVMSESGKKWNPIELDKNVSTSAQRSTLSIAKKVAIAPNGGRKVYFLRTIVKESPTQIVVQYKNHNRHPNKYRLMSTPMRENTSITLEPGKCYTLNVKVMKLVTEKQPKSELDGALIWNDKPSAGAL